MKMDKRNTVQFLMSVQPQTYLSSRDPFPRIALKLLEMVKMPSIKNTFRLNQMLQPKVIRQLQMKVKNL